MKRKRPGKLTLESLETPSEMISEPPPAWGNEERGETTTINASNGASATPPQLLMGSSSLTASSSSPAAVGSTPATSSSFSSSSVEHHFPAWLDPNDFEVDHQIIGRGACSVVKRALHKPTGTMVALKIMNSFDQSKKPQAMEEIKSLLKIDCPAIVKFFGSYYKDGAVTIAIEFMDGGSLSNMLEQVGPLPESVIANICFQILWGLCYLKHDRIIHRDIKPQNILINSSGKVKLTDFGVSKELLSSITMGRTFVGSFKYMAPERLQNLPHTYASDIWAMAIVLYELATGRDPFTWKSLVGETAATLPPPMPSVPPARGGGPGGGSVRSSAMRSSNSEDAASSYIELIQTVLESPVAILPSLSPFKTPYSAEFKQFMAACLLKDPAQRPAPEALLVMPFLTLHGASSLGSAIANVRRFIEGAS